MIEISTYWQKEDPSMEPCAICEEKIISPTYRMIIKVGEKDNPSEVVLCESCYQLKENHGL